MGVGRWLSRRSINQPLDILQGVRGGFWNLESCLLDEELLSLLLLLTYSICVELFFDDDNDDEEDHVVFEITLSKLRFFVDVT